MTNTLDLSNRLVNNRVNNHVDSVSRARYLRDMTTVADRLESLLEMKGWSQSELSERAGLARSHVNRIIKHPDRPTQTDTLAAIAHAAGVSLVWLSKGQGSPDADDSARSPSTTESSVPHMVNAIGFDDALTEAKRRHPEVSEETWEAVGRAGLYDERSIVQAEDLIGLARIREQMADPARIRAMWEAQQAQVEALRAQAEAEGEAKPPEKALRITPRKAR